MELKSEESAVRVGCAVFLFRCTLAPKSFTSVASLPSILTKRHFTFLQLIEGKRQSLNESSAKRKATMIPEDDGENDAKDDQNENKAEADEDDDDEQKIDDDEEEDDDGDDATMPRTMRVRLHEGEDDGEDDAKDDQNDNEVEANEEDDDAQKIDDDDEEEDDDDDDYGDDAKDNEGETA